MKRIQFILSCLVACAIALAVVTQASAETASSPSMGDGLAKVVAVNGAARYRVPGDSNWLPLKAGMILKPGAEIQTGNQGSYVDIVFNNKMANKGFGNVSASAAPASTAAAAPKATMDALRVLENSRMSIDKLAVQHTGAETITDTELNLSAGKVFGTVKKLSASSIYEIKLPNGVAGVRGTIFAVGTDGTVAVVSGSVVVSVVVGGVIQTFSVEPGQMFKMTSTGPQIITVFGNHANATPSDVVAFIVTAIFGKQVVTTPQTSGGPTPVPTTDNNTVIYVSPTS